MQEQLLDAIKKNKSIAMLAPSYVLDFKYPAIIGMLHELGFDKITELTFGARIVNKYYTEYIKEHPEQKYYITSACPTCVALIENQYPELVKYLIPVVSPMAAMAMTYRKHHPDYHIYFITPCFAKQKIEAPKYTQYIDGVITLQELKNIFIARHIEEKNFTKDYHFDSFIQEYTKIYPVSGGLAATAHIKKIFSQDEIAIIDSAENLKKELDLMRSGKSHHRFFDVLNCPGGCIGGPAISNRLMSIKDKKAIIEQYIKHTSTDKLGKNLGTIDYVKDIKFYL